MVHFERDPADPTHCHVRGDTGKVPMGAYLAQFDIVVNCVLQDTHSPMIFVTDRDLAAFSPGSLIVDVSCDAGMGFSWARPTSFRDPMVTVGRDVHYYAVDHSPSLLWDSATWEISEALLPHLAAVLGGPGAWGSHQTISRAIEIRDGVIENPAILDFQHRAPQYPHAQLR
jgi:alanine dehydrogenase